MSLLIAILTKKFRFLRTIGFPVTSRVTLMASHQIRISRILTFFRMMSFLTTINLTTVENTRSFDIPLDLWWDNRGTYDRLR
jgi:hypothetical protein